MPTEYGYRSRPIEFKNIQAAIDKICGDVPPAQFVRELITNGMEAIPEGEAGFVIVDVDWFHHKRYKKATTKDVYKISFADNGKGMSKEQLLFLLHLSASSHEQKIDGNFGFGIKISCLKRNKLGIVVKSWQDGIGHMAVLWFDPNQKEYSLQTFDNGENVLPISEEHKPTVLPRILQGRPFIDKHGTIVTLLGNSPDENTMDLPAPNMPIRERWLHRYTNTKWFSEIPNVRIFCREQWHKMDPANPTKRDTKHNVFRETFFEQHWFEGDSNCRSDHHRMVCVCGDLDCDIPEKKNPVHRKTSACVPAAEAKWVKNFPETWEKGVLVAPAFKVTCYKIRGSKDSNSAHYAPGGHIAFCFKNELYEMVNLSNGATSLFHEFGVIFGLEKLAIYVEPQGSEEFPVYPDLTRSKLNWREQELPKKIFGRIFEQGMPEEIKQYQESSSKATASDADEFLDLLDDPEYKNVINLKAYIEYAGGSVSADPDSFIGKVPLKKEKTKKPSPDADEMPPGEDPDAEDPSGEEEDADVPPEPNPDPTPRPPRKKRNPLQSLYDDESDDDNGVPAKPVVLSQNIPIIHWTNDFIGTELEPFSAEYIDSKNILRINQACVYYTHLIATFGKMFAWRAGAEPVVEKAVRGFFARQFCDAILSTLARIREQKNKGILPGEYLTPNYLTGVASHKEYIYKEVKAYLTRHVGSPRKKDKDNNVLQFPG